jgi:outer membrane protein assembly factor BamB
MILRLACLGTFCVLAAGCAGRDIHQELRDDREVLMRRWTLPTQNFTGLESGERGYEFSNPVVHQNTLIFGSRGKGLVSIYPRLMLTRWTFPIEQGVESPITVAQNTVYFGGGDGFLYAVDAETGKLNWKYELRNPQISQPVLDGNRLFVTTTDDTLYAFDASTGKWLWHYRRRTAQTASIRGASAPVVDGRQVLAGLSDGYLVALGLEDGSLKWEKRLHPGTKFVDVDASVVVSDPHIFVPSYDGSLFCLKRTNGEVIWKYDAGGAHAIQLDEGRVIFPSSDGFIYALDRASGKLLWKFELDGGVPTHIIPAEKYWVVGSSHQYLYALDRTTGEGVYRFNAGWDSGFTSPPTFDPESHRIYALSSAGNLYAFAITKPVKQPLTIPDAAKTTR